MTILKSFVTAYKRPQMLKNLLDELSDNGVHPVVYYDGLDPEYKAVNIITHKHRGKEGFWITWNEMLSHAKDSNADLFLFLQDDLCDIDLGKIFSINGNFSNKPYVCQLVNDGRKNCWTYFPIKDYSYGLEEVGFVDCIFFCNRLALEKIRFSVRPVNKKLKEKMVSSGVGYSLTRALAQKKVPMYRPKKSLAFHGNHESVMHGEHRKKNPLVSK